MNRRYKLDFYQREYIWGEAQVGQLMEDLVNRFSGEFDVQHERSRVESYRPYFLGPIVTVQHGDVRYLVDGQQRITTLNLLFIHLRRSLTKKYPNEAAVLDPLVYSSVSGRKIFNLHDEERGLCMQALLDGSTFDADEQSTSIANICESYETICYRFSDRLKSELLYFSDWLQHRVLLVEVVASDQAMALDIFETMNDRGLPLNNTDLLKSFLLTQIDNEDAARSLNDHWRRRISELIDFEKDGDAYFIQEWLTGNHAETQRRHRSNDGDFTSDLELIETAFHKWVRDNHRAIGLTGPEDYRRFVEHEFLGYSERYLQLCHAYDELQNDFEALYYNGWVHFGVGLPLLFATLLAATTPDDDDEAFKSKCTLVTRAIDIYAARCMVSGSYKPSTVKHIMFDLIKKLRNRHTEEVRQILSQWLINQPEGLEGMRTLALHGSNRWYVHYILARMTSWLDDELKTGIPFDDYMESDRESPFEVEHIWANNFDRHAKEFSSQHEFQDHRNKIGGLLLLPQSLNASLGDKAYKHKIEHYYSQNPLASSLHPKTYEKNPSFMKLIGSYNLSFRAIRPPFTKANIYERQKLYYEIAEIIWDPSRHDLEV